MSKATKELRSFEVGEDEELAIVAGSAFGEQRSIYADPEPGRYAIVPMDELEYDRPDYAEELDIADLEVLGQTATIEPETTSTMTLIQDDELVVRGGDPGVYGLLRIPFERE